MDLAAYLGGDVYIQFWFDTIDQFLNTYEGWYVDDVVVLKAVDNIALGRTDVTASTTISGNLPLFTDGVITTNPHIGLGPGRQWVKLDLGGQYDISEVNVRHYYGDPRTYNDVIIELSVDGVSWVNIFNNDADNSSGQGTGIDAEYVETSAGLDVSLSTPIQARYLRAWSNGSSANSHNHYVELEVYGLSANGATNQAPGVGAGPDQVITLPDSSSLVGSAWDDGLPGGPMTTTWTKTSGPGIVTFGDASLPVTTATFSVDGTYMLRSTADDGDLSSFDELSIEVNPESWVNVALGNTDITASTTISGNLPLFTDGIITTNPYIGLGPGPQWVKLDLGGQYDISEVNVRHYYGDPRTYQDVIVELSVDGVSWVTIFNNDADNSSGRGAGIDSEYVETSAGLGVSLSSPIQARYLRT